MTILANLSNFLLYFCVSAALLVASVMVYTSVIPLHEWRLIREGNVAVAIVIGAVTLGFAFPEAMAVARSSGLLDMVAWAIVSLILQLLCYGGLRLWRRDASAALARGDMAEAVLLAAGAIAIGILNAACLT